MNLIGMSLKKLINRLVLNKRRVDTKVNIKFPCDGRIFEKVHRIIRRISPSTQKEADVADALRLFKLFFYAINYRHASNPDTLALKKLKSALKNNSYSIWECAAVAAGFRKLCNIYRSYNGSAAVRIYRGFPESGNGKSFPEIIQEYNSWMIYKRDMKIINIIMTAIGDPEMPYQTIVKKNGRTVVIPLFNPVYADINCL